MRVHYRWAKTFLAEALKISDLIQTADLSQKAAYSCLSSWG